MNVEIDHCDPAKTMVALGPRGAEDHIVEQAKPHRPARVGMVAGRPHGAKRVVSLTRHDRVNRRHQRARGSQGSLPRARRDSRVGIQVGAPRFGDRSHNLIDELSVMHPRQMCGLRQRRVAPQQRRKRRRGQRIEHGAQPLGAFRVVSSGFVSKASGMCENQRGHDPPSVAGDAVNSTLSRMPPVPLR